MTDVSTFLLGLAVLLVMMVAAWVGSHVRRDASLVDRFWGLAFVVLAWAWGLAGDGERGHRVLMIVLVTVWGIRLAGFITWRNWGNGEDKRYVAMREKDPEGFPLRSLVTVFLGQGVLATIIAAPIHATAIADDIAGPGALAVVGVLVWSVGLFFEAVGDWQLARFLANSSNRGKVMDRGLWRYTRHPNYFGDVTVWWGLWLVALSAGAWWSFYGPVVMTFFIIRISGVAMTDRVMAKGSRREGYEEYVAATNAFIPGPRRKLDRPS